MATPSFSQTLSVVDPQFTAPVSKAGLLEGEKMGAFADTLKLGAGAIVDYTKSSALGDVQTDITKAVDKYNVQSPSYQGLLKNNIDGLQAELNKVKGDPTLAPDAIDVKAREITAQINSETSRLTNARDQGTITPLELEARLDQITRDKVAQNPMFRKEIIAHAAQTKDLLGISNIVTQDISYYNKINEAAKARETRIYKMADDYKLDLNDPKFKDLNGNPDLIAVEAAANTRRGYIGTKLIADTLVNLKDIDSKIKKEDLLAQDIPNKFLQGTMLGLQNRVTELYNMPVTEANYTERLKQLDSLIQTDKNSINQLLGRYRNDPDLAWVRSDYDNMSTLLRNNFKDIKSGKELKEFFDNQYGALDAKQKLGLAQNVNMAEHNFRMGVIKDAGLSLTIPEKTQLMTTTLILAHQFSLSQSSKNIQLSDKVLTDTFGTKLNSGKTQGDMLIEGAVDGILKSNIDDPMFAYSTDTFGNLLKSQNMYINSGALTGNAKLYETDKVMLTLGNSQLRAKNAQFSPDVKGDMVDLIQNYAKDVDGELTKLKGKPDAIIIGSSPDGLLFARKDPNVKVENEVQQKAYIDKFNSVILNRINNSMKAYSTLYNMDTKTAAPEFLTKFYGSTFSNLTKTELDSTPQLTEKQKRANKILGM
jgi:hypothetical protein